VQVDPIKSTLTAPGTQRLKVKYAKLLSIVALKFKLRRYNEDTTLKTIVSIDNGITLIVEKTQTFVTFWEKTYEHVWKQDKVGRCRLIL